MSDSENDNSSGAADNIEKSNASGEKESYKFFREHPIGTIVIGFVVGVTVFWFTVGTPRAVEFMGSLFNEMHSVPSDSTETTDEPINVSPSVEATEELSDSLPLSETTDEPFDVPVIRASTRTLLPTVTTEIPTHTPMPSVTPTPTPTPLPDSLIAIPAPNGCLTVQIPLLGVINSSNRDKEEDCGVTTFILDRSVRVPEQSQTILDANTACGRENGGRLPTLHEWLWAVYGTTDATVITLENSTTEAPWMGTALEISINNNEEWVWYVLPEDDPNNIGVAMWLQSSQGELVARFSPSIGDTARYSYRCYFDN